MVTVLIYYPYLDGTSTSLIDTYYNLKQFDVDIECYVAIDAQNIKNNVEYIQALKKSTPPDFDYKIIPLEKIYKKQFDNLVMSFGIFRFVEELPTNYNHLFLLDAGRVAYDHFVGNSKCADYVRALPNVSVYGGKTNGKFLNMDNYKVWYHKFSKERFNVLKQLPRNNNIVTTQDREKTGNIKYDYLLTNEYHYNRYMRWGDFVGGYWENIGKMVFEFPALGKKVFYSPKNKNCDDGLTEYLGLFGIDDNVEQEIKIDEAQLFEVLGMHEDDVLLNDIRNCEL